MDKSVFYEAHNRPFANVKESFVIGAPPPHCITLTRVRKAWHKLDRVQAGLKIYYFTPALLLYTTQRANLHTPWFKVWSMCLFLWTVTLRIIRSLKYAPIVCMFHLSQHAELLKGNWWLNESLCTSPKDKHVSIPDLSHVFLILHGSPHWKQISNLRLYCQALVQYREGTKPMALVLLRRVDEPQCDRSIYSLGFVELRLPVFCL